MRHEWHRKELAIRQRGTPDRVRVDSNTDGNGLSGYQRVRDFQTHYRVFDTCEFSQYELLRMMKRDFHFLQVKLSVVQAQQRIVVDSLLRELEQQISQLEAWVGVHTKTDIPLSGVTLDLELVSDDAVRLLRALLRIDRALACLVETGESSDESRRVRLRYTRQFLCQIAQIKEVASRNHLHFSGEGKVDGSTLRIEL